LSKNHIPHGAKKSNKTDKIGPVQRLEFLEALAKDGRLSGTAVRVAIALLSFRNGQTGDIFPGFSKIATAAGCKRSTAQGGVYALEKAGWFKVTRSRNDDGLNHSNSYIPNWDRVTEVPLSPAPDAGTHRHEMPLPPAGDAGGCTASRLGRTASWLGVYGLPGANPVDSNPVDEPGEGKKESASGDSLAGLTSDDGGSIVPAGNATPWPVNAFATFWDPYPNKGDRPYAERIFHRIESRGDVDFPTIMHGLERYLTHKPMDRDPMLAGKFLQRGHYLDEPADIDPPF
jgi:hypothetical protein